MIATLTACKVSFTIEDEKWPDDAKCLENQAERTSERPQAGATKGIAEAAR